MKHQLDAGDTRSTSRVKSSCVGPSPPVANTRAARRAGDAKRFDVGVQVIGNRGVPADGDADLGKSLAEPLTIRVEILPARQFAANRKDFALHRVVGVLLPFAEPRIGCFGLFHANQAVTVGVDLLKIRTRSQELGRSRDVTVAVDIHLTKPQRPAR